VQELRNGLFFGNNNLVTLLHPFYMQHRCGGGLLVKGTIYTHSQNATKGLPAFQLSDYWIFSWGGWL